MKKTHKRALGFIGLAIVAVATIFAAFLPGPGASAVSGVTDTVQIRVLGGNADVTILEPQPGGDFLSPDRTIKVEYQVVEQVVITLEYTDPSGVTQTVEIANIDGGNVPLGNYEQDINLIDLGFGYGEYKLIVEGSGPAGVDEDEVTFSYYPINATLEKAPDDGDGSGTGGGTDGEGTHNGHYTVNFEYDETGPADLTGATIIVTDQDGNQMGQELVIEPFPTDKYNVDLSDFVGTKSGTYDMYVTVAYEYNGQTYYRVIKFVVDYTYWGKPVETPDTGGFLGNLNISKTDYLVTGLLVFGMVGICGFAFITKKGKTGTRKRK